MLGGLQGNGSAVAAAAGVRGAEGAVAAVAVLERVRLRALWV
jgi:hypothetical protein